MDTLKEIFKSDKYVRVSSLFNIITIFDSNNYHTNDYEILSKAQREHIGSILEENGYSLETGTSYVHKKTNQKLRFITTSTLGVSPLYELEYQLNEHDVFIVTPGTYFLYLLARFTETKRSGIFDEMMNLIETHPVNLKQLLNYSRHESFYSYFKNNIDIFLKHQNHSIQKNLGRTRPLGSAF